VLKQEIEAFSKFDGDLAGYHKELRKIKKFVHQHHNDLEALLVSPREEKEGSAFTSLEEAHKHHKKHGDMNGHTCLLNECPIHYPKRKKEGEKRDD